MSDVSGQGMDSAIAAGPAAAVSITIIIPTLCEAARRDALLRAIASIQAAGAAPVRILVVVNGQRFDAGLLAALRARGDIDVLQIAEGSATRAQLAGRKAVATAFFSFLDDDDEYLPGALDLRLDLLRAHPQADVAVTNGYLTHGGSDELLYSRLDKVGADPLAELFQQNWLASCNNLMRSASVTVAHFEAALPYMEWTWLAFRLALEGKRPVVSNVPTFRYHNTPGSLSKSASYLSSRVALYEHMLALAPPAAIRTTLKRRLCSAWHEISVAEQQDGRRRAALHAHLMSMSRHWSGLKFLPFSRHLLFA